MKEIILILFFPLLALGMAGQHSHAIRDLRNALIEVERIEGTTLYYADIEAQEVGPDLKVEVGPEFGLFEVGVEKDKWTLKPVKRAVRKGDFGILSYCDYCKAAISLRLLPGPHKTVVSVDPLGKHDTH